MFYLNYSIYLATNIYYLFLKAVCSTLAPLNLPKTDLKLHMRKLCFRPAFSHPLTVSPCNNLSYLRFVSAQEFHFIQGRETRTFVLYCTKCIIEASSHCTRFRDTAWRHFFLLGTIIIKPLSFFLIIFDMFCKYANFQFF